MSLVKRFSRSFVVLLFLVHAVFKTSCGDALQCDPCIDRPDYRIQAIVHGTSDDPFWQRVRASSIQAGKDLRVQLDFELYDKFDPESMASDISGVANSPFPPDALIVTIPSPVVETAVREAAVKVPIFGLNSGYKMAKDAGVMDFVSMDERLAGEEAAVAFMKAHKNITNALFINHEEGNTAIQDRLDGFRHRLGVDVPVEQLFVDRRTERIEPAFNICSYDIVLLAGVDSTLNATLNTLNANGCSFQEQYVGGFDTGSQAYASIATGRLLFTISQQAHLQGTLSVLAAATYATTEKKLSMARGEFGIYLSGPLTIDISNLPTDTVQECESDAFPVCPNTLTSDGSRTSSCECLDRSKIKIGGVLHGITTDHFWDTVFAQAVQAADDLGVQLDLDRIEPQPSTEILQAKMAQRMISLCQEGVDGLFVSIPSELVHPAIELCKALNVPVISVNSGASDAEILGVYHHISQLEYEAGYEAGKRMANEGVTEGICLVYMEGNTALSDRCEGFEAGMKEVSPDITYLGNRFVPFDSQVLYIEQVQKLIGRDGDWDGLGTLSIGPQTLEALVELKKMHTKMVIGTFDTNNYVYDQLDSGTLLFGIDQNPFMQGLMPVWLLSILAHTQQHLQNQYIMTGPSFVDESPSGPLMVCTANDFEVCKPPEDYDFNHITKIRPYGLAMSGISMSLSVVLSIWVGYNRNTAVVRKSQPLFLLMICIGTFLMAATIIPLSIDDSIASEESCTKACNSYAWLLMIGFITCFSALFSKLYRIKKLIDSAVSFRRVKISSWDVMRPFFVLLALSLVFLVVWTVVDPQYWDRAPVSGSTDGLITYGTCVIGRTWVSKAMLSCLTILAFSCVLMACVAAWNGRRVSVEFSESTYVGMVVIGMLQVLLLGMPLIALVYANPTAGYFVKSAIIFVLTISILLLIFVPKIIFLQKERAEIGGIVRPNARINIGALKVVGTSKIIRRVSGFQSELNASNHIVPLGISLTQIDTLKERLKDVGTIDDDTDLRSLIEKAGILVTSEP